MFLKNLLTLLLITLTISLYSVEKSDFTIVEEKIKEMGFYRSDLNFKKDFSVNDTFAFPLADTILNNPLFLMEKRYSILDSVAKPLVNNKYMKFNDVFQMTDTLASDIALIMRKHEKMGFDKSKAVIQVIPMLFYEESLSYKYKGIIEQNLGQNIDTNNLTADSLISYMQYVTSKFDDIKPFVNGYKKRLIEMFSEGLLFPVDTVISSGRMVIGDIYSNTYYDDADIIIDLGGDDKYLNSSGVAYPYTMRTRFIVDFSGNDSYETTDSFKVSYGAINGVQFIYDMDGDDRYNTGNFSLGSSFIGFSQLTDESGDDVYSSGIMSQGASFYGYGELIDKEGDDIYTAACFAQGFGFVKGTGALLDSSGNDTYRAGMHFSHAPLLEHDYLSMSQGFGFGIRPRTGGGLGILADYKGNDTYSASVFGQGGSYWHSVGLLFDFQGNDYYTAAQYAQGSGIHLSVGGLFDYAGDDMYFSRFGPSQGEGHDFAVGMLCDKKGNDTYTVSGGQGAGLNNSVGILLDREGDDSYYSRENFACGDVNESRGFYGFGAFIDLEGNDFYTKAGEKDSISWINKYYGIGIDSPVMFKDSMTDTFNIPDNLSIEELFKIASEWDVADNKFKVEKARKMLFQRDEEAFKHIISKKLDTDDGLELRTMIEFFKQTNERHIDTLIAKMKTNNLIKKRNIIYMLGEIKCNHAFSKLKEECYSSDEKTRQLALYAVGSLDTTVNLDFIKDVYTSSSYRIKVEAAEALKKHKYDLTGHFVKVLKTEKERPARQALSNYLSEFPNTLRLFKEDKTISNYEEYIAVYKIISKEGNGYLIKTYQEFLRSITKKDAKDKTNIKAMKKRILNLINKKNN
ncbi:MAG: HEAT repeat domain-containing protein [bacterium]